MSGIYVLCGECSHTTNVHRDGKCLAYKCNCKEEKELDKKKTPAKCMHAGCWRDADKIGHVSGNPKHREFKDQTHDCCPVHSRVRKVKDA